MFQILVFEERKLVAATHGIVGFSARDVVGPTADGCHRRRDLAMLAGDANGTSGRLQL